MERTPMAGRDEEYERKRQQIIAGALAVFSEKGFHKATNQEIAEAAGIASPGLIYHYFDSKADLLRQVMSSRAPLLQSVMRDEALLTMPPRKALGLIGSAFLDALNNPDNLRLFRVTIGEAMRDPAVVADWHRASSLPAKRGLVHYLEVKMQAGELRRANPVAAANCFLGAFVLYALSNELFGPTDAPLDPDTMLAEAVEIFLRGMEAV
jgi:TetR/AcrR family transcriptional regulator, mexJK operon transcriptional repressor